MIPAVSAAIIRGKRHCISSSSIVPLIQRQPSASRPNESATSTPSSSTTSPASANHGTFCRSAGTLSPTSIEGALILRKRGSSHSSSGAPISAVIDPVETSIHTRASHWISWSDSQRIRAPISGASIRRASSRRAPSILASRGANSPIKPIIPTAFTSNALSTIASVSAARRTRDNARPRLRATPSSSPISVNGRSNNKVSTTPPINCGQRCCTPRQSV